MRRILYGPSVEEIQQQCIPKGSSRSITKTLGKVEYCRTLSIFWRFGWVSALVLALLICSWPDEEDGVLLDKYLVSILPYLDTSNIQRALVYISVSHHRLCLLSAE